MTTRNKITSIIIKAAFALLLAASPAFAMQGHGVRAVEQLAFAAVASRDVIVYQGQAVNELLAATGLETSGRGLRAHIRTATPTATVIQILTYNGSASARVAFATGGVQMTIGAAVSSLWLVNADRVEWVYDVESYSLSDADDVLVTHRGKFIVYGNRTRESDVTASAQMPSGDGRYVRFDGVQGLSAGQQLQARENIGAGTGGGSSAWGGITGTLTDQTDLNTALGLKAPLASPTFTGTPAAPTAAGATSTTQIATTAFVGGEITTHSALTTGAHGITAAGAALLDDATAADQRTTLGLGTAATTAATAYEASGAIATHNSVTTAHGISAFGATLVDDADAATARTTLGLGTAATSASGDFATAGHNHSGVYQPADAELTAIAGLTSAADSAPYFTGSGTAALMTVTAAGRAIIDDADASAQRTTLGLGTAATTAASDYATAAQGTDDRTASGLRSASTVVSVSAATAPSSGQVLTATSSTAANWQTPSAGSPAGSSGQMQYNNASAFGAANLWREDANTVTQRNGTTPQAGRWANTWTDGSNYELGRVQWVSGVLTIGTLKAGTGSARALAIQTDGVTALSIGTSQIVSISALNITGAYGLIASGVAAPLRGFRHVASATTLTSYTLALTDSGSFYTATSGSDQEFTMPASPVAGAWYGFKVSAGKSSYLRFTANTGQKIRLAGGLSASAGYVRSNTGGSFVYLMYDSTDAEWVAWQQGGTWTIDS